MPGEALGEAPGGLFECSNPSRQLQRLAVEYALTVAGREVVVYGRDGRLCASGGVGRLRVLDVEAGRQLEIEIRARPGG